MDLAKEIAKGAAKIAVGLALYFKVIDPLLPAVKMPASAAKVG